MIVSWHCHEPLTSLQVGTLPESRCLAVRFPLKYGRLSIVVAIMRGYPFLKQQAEKQLGKEPARKAMSLGFMEVCSLKEKEMWIALPLGPGRDDMLPF